MFSDCWFPHLWNKDHNTSLYKQATKWYIEFIYYFYSDVQKRWHYHTNNRSCHQHNIWSHKTMSMYRSNCTKRSRESNSVILILHLDLKFQDRPSALSLLHVCQNQPTKHIENNNNKNIKQQLYFILKCRMVGGSISQIPHDCASGSGSRQLSPLSLGRQNYTFYHPESHGLSQWWSFNLLVEAIPLYAKGLQKCLVWTSTQEINWVEKRVWPTCWI